MLKDQGDRYNGALSHHTSEQSAWQTVSQWGYHRRRPSPLQLSDTGWVTANLPQCHLLISLGLCCCNPHMYCCVYWQRERERESITMKAITLGSEVINTVFSNPPFFKCSASTGAGSRNLPDTELCKSTCSDTTTSFSLKLNLFGPSSKQINKLRGITKNIKMNYCIIFVDWFRVS